MKKLTVLLKREYWENQVSFYWLPLGFAIMLVLLNASGWVLGRSLVTIFWSKLNVEELLSSGKFEGFTGGALGISLTIVAAILGSILVIVQLFYLVSSLYDEKKDRSILFWKSMPVSDSLTVVSKFTMGVIIAPAFYLAITLIAQILLILSTSVVMPDSSSDGGVWSQVDFAESSLSTLRTYGTYTLFMLPTFAWAMVASGISKKFPLLIFLFAPFVLWIVENIALPENYISGLFFNFSCPDLYGNVYVGGAVHLAAGIGLLAAAVYLRRTKVM